jgi:hypothetical protein
VLVTVPESPVVTTVPVVAGRVIVVVPAAAEASKLVVPDVEPAKDRPVPAIVLLLSVSEFVVVATTVVSIATVAVDAPVYVNVVIPVPCERALGLAAVIVIEPPRDTAEPLTVTDELARFAFVIPAEPDRSAFTIEPDLVSSAEVPVPVPTLRVFAVLSYQRLPVLIVPGAVLSILAFTSRLPFRSMFVKKFLDILFSSYDRYANPIISWESVTFISVALTCRISASMVRPFTLVILTFGSNDKL